MTFYIEQIHAHIDIHDDNGDAPGVHNQIIHISLLPSATTRMLLTQVEETIEEGHIRESATVCIDMYDTGANQDKQWNYIVPSQQTLKKRGWSSGRDRYIRAVLRCTCHDPDHGTHVVLEHP